MAPSACAAAPMTRLLFIALALLARANAQSIAIVGNVVSGVNNFLHHINDLPYYEVPDVIDAAGASKLVLVVGGEHSFNGNSDGFFSAATFDGAPMEMVEQEASTPPTVAMFYLDNPKVGPGRVQYSVNNVNGVSYVIYRLSGTVAGQPHTRQRGKAPSTSVSLTHSGGASIVIAGCIDSGLNGGNMSQSNLTPLQPLVPGALNVAVTRVAEKNVVYHSLSVAHQLYAGGITLNGERKTQRYDFGTNVLDHLYAVVAVEFASAFDCSSASCPAADKAFRGGQIECVGACVANSSLCCAAVEPQVTVLRQLSGRCDAGKDDCITESVNAVGASKLVIVVGGEHEFPDNITMEFTAAKFGEASMMQAVQESSALPTIAMYFLDNPAQGTNTIAISRERSNGTPWSVYVMAGTAPGAHIRRKTMGTSVAVVHEGFSSVVVAGVVDAVSFFSVFF
jgi:hypothetical protein